MGHIFIGFAFAADDVRKRHQYIDQTGRHDRDVHDGDQQCRGIVHWNYLSSVRAWRLPDRVR